MKAKLIALQFSFSLNEGNFFLSPFCFCSVKTDVVFGKHCGFSTLLVGTGRYQWKHVEKFLEMKLFQYVPDFYIPSLGDFKQYF